MGKKRVRGIKKIKIGIVTSNKMDKTIVVTEKRRVLHPMYKKYIIRTSKFMAHDPENRAREGDLVRIIESRPLSRRKRWRLLEILESAEEE